MSIKKVTNYHNQPQMDDINRLIREVEILVESGGQGEQGEKGEDGSNGWTPVLSLAMRDDDVVIQVADLVGGTGTQPLNVIGMYVGENGLVSDIINAVNIRGLTGYKGEAGEDGANGQGVPLGGTTGQVLAKLSDDSFDTGWVEQSGGGGATNFTDLNDTPSSLGTNGQVLTIEYDAGTFQNRIAWKDLPNIPSRLTDLNDTPSSLGNDGQVLVVRTDPNTFQKNMVFETPQSGGGGGGVSIETGTFIPTFYDFNKVNTINANFLQRVGTYIKVGNLVTVRISMRYNNAASRTSFCIADLPFTPASEEANTIPVTIARYQNDNLPQLCSYINNNGQTTKGDRALVADYRKFNHSIVIRLDSDSNVVSNLVNAAITEGFHLSFSYLIDDV